METTNIEQKDQFFGAINAFPSEKTYKIAGGVTVLPKPKYTFDDKQIQYNQVKVSGVSCTVFGSMGAISDQTGFVFPFEKQKENWDKALSLGATSKGWYIDKAVDVVRDQYNALHPERELKSFEINMRLEELFYALDMGYSVVTGFSGSKEYNLDKMDGVLDGVKFGQVTYGHCIRITKRSNGDFVIDNYFTNTNKNNIYEILNRENLKKLVQNRVFFSFGHIFVDEIDFNNLNDLEKAFADVPIWGHSTVQKCIDKKLKTDWSDWATQLADAKVEDAFCNLGVLTKKEGFVSVLRFYMAVDRLGQIDKL